MRLTIKINMFIKLLIVIFALYGIRLLVSDFEAFVIYVIQMSFFGIVLYITVKSNNLLLFEFIILMFLSQGLNSPLFFLYREKSSRTGYGAIGNFQFEIYEFYKASYGVMVFTVLVVLFAILGYRRKNRRGSLECVIEIINSFSAKLKRSVKIGHSAKVSLWIICFFGIILSMWMYHKQIGITGLPQTALPFHLTGILGYFRKLGITVLIYFYYFSAEKKNGLWIPILLYGFIGGIFAGSKLVPILVTIPIAVNSFITKKYGRVLLAGVVCLFFYYFMGHVKEAMYEIYGVNGSLESINIILERTFKNMFADKANGLEETFYNFTGSLHGVSSVVLASQYHILSMSDNLLYYFKGISVGQLVPDMASRMYGLNLPEGFSFGVALGYPGEMVLLSNGNFCLVVLQALIIAFVLRGENNCIERILANRNNVWIKLVSIAIGLLNILEIWQGNFKFTYLGLIILFLLCNTHISNTKSM